MTELEHEARKRISEQKSMPKLLQESIEGVAAKLLMYECPKGALCYDFGGDCLWCWLAEHKEENDEST